MADSTETISESLEITPEGFAQFSAFITGELGIKMSEAKISMLQSRLMRRLRHLKLNSLEEYRRYLFDSRHAEEERVHFIDAVTTNKTDFFREPVHFDYLTRTALPNICSRHKQGSSINLKLWSAGCSSGEEPYTLAMVLSEFVSQRAGADFLLLGTDVSTRVLKHARLGIYAEARVEPVSGPLRAKYLLRSKDPSQPLVRVVPELRERITFHRLNFMDQVYPLKDTFDAIFFRNVMIYFDRQTQEQVINRMCRHLAPGGYLFVGHSESLTGLNIPVVPVAAAVFRKPL